MIVYPALIFAISLAPQKLRPNVITDVLPTGFTKVRFEEAANHEPVDMLILGSSHAYRGFDPRIFEEKGIITFNLGTTAQTPIQSELILETFIDQFAPTRVLLEVYPWGFTSDGIESSIDLLYYGRPIDRLTIVRKTPTIRVLNSSIYAALSGSKLEEMRSKKDQYISGGYVEREVNFLRSISQSSKSWNWNEDQFEAMSRIVAKCRERNIQLVLVQAPTTWAFYSSFTNNQEFEGRMKEYGAYYNFNGLPALEDSLHFYDEDHLNQAGVSLFNKALLDTLLSQDDLD